MEKSLRHHARDIRLESPFEILKGPYELQTTMYSQLVVDLRNMVSHSLLSEKQPRGYCFVVQFLERFFDSFSRNWTTKQ